MQVPGLYKLAAIFFKKAYQEQVKANSAHASFYQLGITALMLAEEYEKETPTSKAGMMRLLNMMEEVYGQSKDTNQSVLKRSKRGEGLEIEKDVSFSHHPPLYLTVVSHRLNLFVSEYNSQRQRKS